MRKVFLEDLPRKYGIGNNKNKIVIDWINCVNKYVEFIYDDIEGEIQIVSYKNSYLFLKYLDKEVYRMGIENFKKCNFAELLNKKTKEFKISIGVIFKDKKRDLKITNTKYKKNNYNREYKWYEYYCNKCGYNGEMVESSLLNGIGCPCCSANPLVVVEGINDIPTTAPWMVKYFQDGYNEANKYTAQSGKTIYPICSDCGKIKDKPMRISDIHNSKSIGCTCSDGKSYPNKFMYSFLEQLNKLYSFNCLEYEYSPEWMRPKRYDNYFEYDDKKYIVEMDGGWHTIDNLMSGITAEENKKIDDYKDSKADEYSIKMIRIDCNKSELEYIKNNIIKSKLSNMFDLSKIDWLKCHEYGLRNIVKIVCEYKMNNPDKTTSNIGNIMKLSENTIRRYLKRGTILGWCNYNPKLESFKGTSKSGKLREKSLEIFKNGISLGIFSSICKLERQSEKLFGVKLCHSSLSKACNNKSNSYKGFTFSYINKELNNPTITQEATHLIASFSI